MAAGPKFYERVRLGVDERVFAKHLKRFARYFRRVGHDAVDCFLTIDICLVLGPAREAVRHWFPNESQNCQGESQDSEHGPVLCRLDAPGGSVARHGPVDEVKRQPEAHEGQGATKRDAQPDVMQNVVTHFVSKDEGDFVRGRLHNGGVPHDDAFRSTDASHIGIELRRLIACFHEEHSLARNFDTAVRHDSFEPIG